MLLKKHSSLSACYCHILHKVYSKLLPRGIVDNSVRAFSRCAMVMLVIWTLQSKISQDARSKGEKRNRIHQITSCYVIQQGQYNSDTLQQQTSTSGSVSDTSQYTSVRSTVGFEIFKIMLSGQEGKM
jgi:hypothetical protein